MFANLAALALFVAAPTPVPAVSADAETANPTTVETSFTPPLDRPARYRRSRAIDRNGRVETSWNVVDYRFTRREGGYRVEVVEVEWGMEGMPPEREALYRRLAALLTRPFVLLVNETGEIVEIENEEQLWADIESALRTAIAEQSSIPENLRAMMTQFITLYTQRSPEARRAELLREAQPIFEFASVDLALGGIIRTEVPAEGLFGAAITYQMAIRPERVDDGHLFLSVGGTAPSADLRAMAEHAVAGIGASVGGPGAAGAQVARQRLQNIEIQMGSEATYEVELASGLMRRHHYVERVSAEGEGVETNRTTTVTMARIM